MRASDIDMVYLTGYGFPLLRGGPMYYADQQGLFNVVQAMKRFAANPHDDASSGSRRRCWPSSRPKARRSAERLEPRPCASGSRCLRARRRSRWPLAVGVKTLAHAVAPARGRGGQAGRRSTPRRRASGSRRRCASRRSRRTTDVDANAERVPGAAGAPAGELPEGARDASTRGHRQVRAALHLARQRRQAAAPIALMAHQDVVPIAPGTEGDWQVAPFAGAQQGRLRLGPWRVGRQGQPHGASWRRSRCCVGSGLPAAPDRSISSSAQDEEVGGERGALQIAAAAEGARRAARASRSTRAC